MLLELDELKVIEITSHQAQAVGQTVHINVLTIHSCTHQSLFVFGLLVLTLLFEWFALYSLFTIVFSSIFVKLTLIFQCSHNKNE